MAEELTTPDFTWTQRSWLDEFPNHEHRQFVDAMSRAVWVHLMADRNASAHAVLDYAFKELESLRQGVGRDEATFYHTPVPHKFITLLENSLGVVYIKDMLDYSLEDVLDIPNVNRHTARVISDGCRLFGIKWPKYKTRAGWERGQKAKRNRKHGRKTVGTA